MTSEQKQALDELWLSAKVYLQGTNTIDDYWFNVDAVAGSIGDWDELLQKRFQVECGSDLTKLSYFRPGKLQMWDYIICNGSNNRRGPIADSAKLCGFNLGRIGNPGQTLKPWLSAPRDWTWITDPEFFEHQHDIFHKKVGRVRKRRSLNQTWNTVSTTTSLFFASLAEAAFARLMDLRDTRLSPHIKIRWCSNFCCNGTAPKLFSDSLRLGGGRSTLPVDRSVIEILVYIDVGDDPLALTNPGMYEGEHDYLAYRPVRAAVAGWCPSYLLYCGRLAKRQRPLESTITCFAVPADELLSPKILTREFLLEIAGLSDYPGSVDNVGQAEYEYEFPCQSCFMFGAGDAVGTPVRLPWRAPDPDTAPEQMLPQQLEFASRLKSAMTKIRRSMRKHAKHKDSGNDTGA